MAFPLPTLAAQVTTKGITAPSYADILASLQASFQSIYGSDVYLAADSQDGQLLALFAAAINDANNMAIAVYNSFSPTFAQGAGLSSVVKINGIQRLIPSFSTAVGNVVGVAGTVINNGVVKDGNGNLWNLPPSVTIPGGGSIAVTVTAQAPGAIAAPSGTINKINTPVLGWQSFASTSDAVAGQPVETDAALRGRQTVSTSLAAITPVAALLGAVSNLPGVLRAKVYENPTGSADGNGLPAHSISVVVQGGSVQDIVNAIGLKKTPGAATYGSTSGTFNDPITGINYTINFYVLAVSEIKVHVTIHALAGFASPTEVEIQNAVAAYLNALPIGQAVQYSRMFTPAYLNGAADGATYEVTALTIALGAGSPDVVDITIPFNSAAVCVAATDVTITVS